MTRLVSHEHLRAHLRVVATSCEMHGVPGCTCLDHRARYAEGSLPPGFTIDDDLETSGQLLESCIAFAAVCAIVLTVGWLAYFVFARMCA